MPQSLILITLLAIAGCGDDDPTPGIVDLGTGTVEWEALAPGADIDVIAGPQGGHHLIVHARIQALSPGDPAIPGDASNPTTKFRAFLGAEQVDMDFPPYQLGYEDGGDGYHYLASGRLLVLREDRLAELYDQQVRITVDVEDASGTTASDERTVRAVEAAEIPDGPDAGPDADAMIAP